ncbi:MAG: response regulator [Acidobacteriaceae bacterium]|nr:response regulator [Acidobacteriaceae bacterium]MBV9036880.1 response regulator [Acidobacteriaceae bacterium]MBV9225114.1 response regulator [Acidobacteriaceae bacterium]MBV9308813.1 response regulator [Acidobacteriaceae bacterium]MBV9678528.1 response regulator [Acidobacteriaceae bacterium]
MENAQIRALIVEDSEDDAYLVERVLRQHGYQPECRRVQTAREMLDALANGEWDLIISDYLLPEFNAMGALQLYRDADLDIPFIVVSGSIGETVAVEAMKSGVHDYLMKDNLTRLAVTVERELREAKNRRERRALSDGLSSALQEALVTIKQSNEAALRQVNHQLAVRNSLEQSLQAANRALETIAQLVSMAQGNQTFRQLDTHR